jgi:hypothetical protein
MDPPAERDDLEAWLFTTGPLGNRPVFGDPVTHASDQL